MQHSVYDTYHLCFQRGQGGKKLKELKRRQKLQSEFLAAGHAFEVIFSPTRGVQPLPALNSHPLKAFNREPVDSHPLRAFNREPVDSHPLRAFNREP